MRPGCRRDHLHDRVEAVTADLRGAHDHLAARLKRSGALPQAEAVGLCRALAMALFSAHQKGVVHLNLRPESVIFSRSASTSMASSMAGEQVRLTDLGVFKALGQKGRSVQLRAPAYLAPEQAQEGGLVNRQADVYALGAMLYEMLAGRPPFTGTRDVVLLAHRSTAPLPLCSRSSLAGQRLLRARGSARTASGTRTFSASSD